MSDNLQQYDKLGAEVMELSRNRLIINYRFLASAINRLSYRTYEETITTDGLSIFFNPIYILKEYKISQDVVARMLLHQILHCVFRHFFIDCVVDQDKWDLACDIAVESIILELGDQFLLDKDTDKKLTALRSLKEKTDIFTAEKLYFLFSDDKIGLEELVYLYKLFHRDDHLMWYEPKSFRQTPKKTAGKWEQISKKIETDLRMFEKRRGEKSLSLIQNLKSVNRQAYDYEEFLRKFAITTEQLRVNDEEFDYIFYTYGLEKYKDIPLIEPLEYKDDKRINEFVIAIDTSASCKGEKVFDFLQKTYNILKSQDSFDKRSLIHIIQCDSKIQSDHVIRDDGDLQDYFNTIDIKGLGGTDFRPVFEYIKKLRTQGELTKLRGLIYFTDGYGEFPKEQPDYKTAFVFLDDEYNNPDVPVWAIKLVLPSEYLKPSGFKDRKYKV